MSRGRRGEGDDAAAVRQTAGRRGGQGRHLPARRDRRRAMRWCGRGDARRRTATHGDARRRVAVEACPDGTGGPGRPAAPLKPQGGCRSLGVAEWPAAPRCRSNEKEALSAPLTRHRCKGINKSSTRLRLSRFSGRGCKPARGSLGAPHSAPLTVLGAASQAERGRGWGWRAPSVRDSISEPARRRACCGED